MQWRQDPAKLCAQQLAAADVIAYAAAMRTSQILFAAACLLFVLCTTSTSADDAALAIFQKRIVPILQAQRPSSCSECHLSGVDLKDYIRPTQPETFAALRDAGLIDLKTPAKSKLL